MGSNRKCLKDVESECEVTLDHRCNASASSDTGNSCTSRKYVKSARRFFKPWKAKFAWLSYDESENFMFCQVCMEKNKKNGMTEDAKCRNFQYSILVRYAALPEH